MMRKILHQLFIDHYFLQKLGERNTRVLERDSQNIKIDKPNAMIKMIIDDMKNYVYLYKDDLIKLGAA